MGVRPHNALADKAAVFLGLSKPAQPGGLTRKVSPWVVISLLEGLGHHATPSTGITSKESIGEYSR